MWKILWLIAFRQVKFHHREFIYLTFRGDKDKQTANAKQTCTLINGEEILWILHTEIKKKPQHINCASLLKVKLNFTFRFVFQ